MPSLHIRLLVGAALALIGCGSSTSSESRTEGDLRITPNGDETTASFVLALPAGVCTQPGACAKVVASPSFYLDGMPPIVLGKPLRVKPGTYTLWDRGNARMTVSLPVGTTSTLELAVLTQRCVADPLPPVPKTDFGFRPQPWTADCPMATRFNGVLQGAPVLEPDVARAVLPGRYTFEGGGAAEEQVIAAGEVKDLTLRHPVIWGIPDTFDTKVTFVDPVELPTASSPGELFIDSSCGTGYYGLNTDPHVSKTLKAYKANHCEYSLLGLGRRIPLNQSGNDIKLHRIDVDDVVVTRDDGSTFTTKGNYRLEVGGHLVFGSVVTGTGVDVLPGKYDVVVEYTTAFGPQVKRYSVSF
jgi:hypothetical protein